MGNLNAAELGKSINPGEKQGFFMSQTAFGIYFLVSSAFKTTMCNQDLNMNLNIKLQKPTNKNKKKKEN